MKTQHLLKIVSISSLFAMAISLSASEALLSPRAKDSQNKIVASKSTDFTAMKCSRWMVASPKAVGECASHPSAPMSCCAVATAK